MASDLVNVGNFRFVPEAEAARLRLEQEGIQAFLSNAELVNMDWFVGNATGWVKIFVPTDQADAARAVLNRVHDEAQSRRRDRAARASSEATCLACGARMPPGSAVCSACGWTYAVDRDESDDDAPGDDEPAHERAPIRRAARSVPDALDEEAAERAETEATNFRLLFGILVGGIIAFWLLPTLRAAFQRVLP